MKEHTEGKVTILVRESYLARVQGAVGTSMFRHLYASVGGRRRDILGDGDRSCALFVSTVLVGFHLVGAVHAAVASTIHDMERNGWTRIPRPRKGCVIVWNAVNEQGQAHHHIGFYTARGTAISNSSRTRVPTIHPYRVHKVHALYWHAKLD